MKRKICFVTGSRADYGIMSKLMQALRDDERADLQIVATNMHLSPAHGLTYKEIEADGLTIDCKIPMPTDDDSARSTVKSMGIAMQGIADAFAELKPDVVVILGDRYEMLAVASAACIFGIPIAHLHGGEITEGAYDDSIRHAITKLSYLHFASTAEYRNRIIQMGEAPERVFNVGSLAVEGIKSETPMSRQELSDSLDFELDKEFLLTTFHPVTMQPGEAKAQVKALLDSLETFLPDYKVIITLPNSDSEGRAIAEMMTDWAVRHPGDSIAVTSLGRRRYYAALNYCSAVVGNSSSGLIEAPSFGKPTVNIGDRQKGRAQGNTIINCSPTVEGITRALSEALSVAFRDYCAEKAQNPYAGIDTLQTVLDTLINFPLPHQAVKHFHDLKKNDEITC